jgi:hypothetical protein
MRCVVLTFALLHLGVEKLHTPRASVWPPPWEFAKQRSRAGGIRAQSGRNLVNADVSKFPKVATAFRFRQAASRDTLTHPFEQTVTVWHRNSTTAATARPG